MVAEPAPDEKISNTRQTFAHAPYRGVTALMTGSRPLLLLLLLVLQGMNCSASEMTATAEPNPSPEAGGVNAQSLVTIGKQARNRAGIRTLLLQPADYLPETSAYGEVLDIQPLLELRSRYFSALSEQRIAQAALQLSAQNLKRLRSLFQAKAAAQKNYLQQKMQWQTDQARVDAASHQLDSIEQTLLLHWGETLASHVMDPDSKLFRDLAGLRRRLLLITLTTNQTVPANLSRISISPTGKRRHAMPADYLAASPRSNSLLQGNSYFILCDNPALQTNMHITAWITSPGPPLTGVIIPASALIRHLGQTYVYLQLGDGTFARRAIPRLMNLGRGYFIPSGIGAGEQLVIAGAQLLLSEEFRGQIPDEDDD